MRARSRHAAWRYGLEAEAVCAWWLRLHGYRIVARRYRTPVGEIDLVARRGKILAFVVKARRDDTAAVPLARQRRRIVRAAEAFLQRKPRFAGLAIRFDVMSLGPWRLPRHLSDAWRVDDAGR